MERAFLEGLSLDEEAIDAILAEHGRVVGAMRFDAALEKAVSAAGGRNIKAISALLDLDGIRSAEEPEKAMTAALRQLKRENGYLFNEVRQPYAAGQAQPVHRDYTQEDLAAMSMEEYRRFRNGM